MQPSVRPPVIVHTRFIWPGENMREPKQSVQLRDGAIMTFWDLFPRNKSRAGQISDVLEKTGACEPAFYKEDQSREDIVSVFLKDRHVDWMRWFQKEIEARYQATRGGLEIIADVLEEGFEDPKSFALAFIDVAIRTSDSDEEPLAIAGDQKEDLRRLIEHLAVSMGLRHPDLVAATAVAIIEQTIVRTLMAGSPTEAPTARLLFQCLQHC